MKNEGNYFGKFVSRLKGLLFSDKRFYEEIRRASWQDSVKFWVPPIIVYGLLNVVLAPFSPYAQFAANPATGILTSPVVILFMTFTGFLFYPLLSSVFVWIGARIFRVKIEFVQIYKHVLYIWGFTGVLSYLIYGLHLFLSESIFETMIRGAILTLGTTLVALYFYAVAISNLCKVSKLKALGIYIVGFLAPIVAIFVVMLVLIIIVAMLASKGI